MLPETHSVETKNGDHRPLESRSRMISFRLTAEEYERFRTLCFARGLRNVSEMVRAAVNQLAHPEASLSEPIESQVPIAVTDRLTVIEARLTHLESRVNHSLLKSALKANAQS